MILSGIISLGAGHCVSICDMVRTALSHRGINSRLTEVKTTLTYFREDPPDIGFIGFDDIKNPGEHDSHVILITETDPPFLIDPSIPHRLPKNIFAIVQPIVKKENKLIDVEFKKYQISATYIEKEVQRIPYVHASSIINRIETDKKIFSNLNFLKIFVILAMAISSLNLIRGGIDYYQTWIDDKNFWGPTHMKEIYERVERIEQKINQGVNENGKGQRTK